MQRVLCYIRGRFEHPVESRAHRAMEINHRMRTLAENLQKAVAEENYETAASLRDQIKQLESELAS